MPAAAQLDAEIGDVVGKKDLCDFLGWSRPTLDARLKKDPLFPVRSRGDRTGGWEFEPKAVEAYLKGEVLAAPVAAPEPEPEPAEPEVEAAEPTAKVHRFPAQKLQHTGEATARQMRDTADAELKFDRLRRMRGELVEAADVREVLATLLVEMRSTLTALPDQLVRDFGLSDRLGFAVRAKIEGAMRGLVTKLQSQLNLDPIDPDA